MRNDKQKYSPEMPGDQFDINRMDRGHGFRVGELSRRIAQQLQMPKESILLIGMAAFLHDIGKLAMPEAILNKPAALTAREWSVMRRHTRIGADIIRRLPEKCFAQMPPQYRKETRRLAIEIALGHHEKLDGSGYEGLWGDEIKLPQRITAVADVFDALTHDRPYRPAKDMLEAYRYLWHKPAEYDRRAVLALGLAALDHLPEPDKQ